MIRPAHFGFNAETAVNNSFQSAGTEPGVAEKAQQEFDAFVQVLLAHGVDVLVAADEPEPHTPDALFPNNWVSFHEDGRMLLYPMFAHNRRLERKPGVIEKIAMQFRVTETIDLSYYENEGLFLEGTGSMVLDRDHKIAYACLSPRTNYLVLADFCERMGYTPVVFDATDQQGRAIYHTNVMMCVAAQYVAICLDAITAQREKDEVAASILQTGKEVIPLSLAQMNHFAGNMLQVCNAKGEQLLVMSSQAFDALTKEQLEKLTRYNAIVHSPLTVIETNGGGSARCMMAEIHLPVQ